MKQLWLVIAGVLLVLLVAGCQPTGEATASRTPTSGPINLTQRARTAVARSVEQTIDAQDTIEARNPIFWPSPIPPPTSTPFPTPVVTLTYTPTVIRLPAPTPIPTVFVPQPETAQPGAIGGVTLSLKPGFSLELRWGENLNRAKSHTPSRGRYLVLHGALINRADHEQCAYSREIRLGFEGNRYAPYVEGMSALRRTYNTNYPGPIRGQCVAPGAQESTYILFDVPLRMVEFALFYRNVRVGSLRLIPRADGNVDIIRES